MAGIERIQITDTINGRGAWRFKWSQKRWPIANAVYRQVFKYLLPDDKIIECTKDEFMAGYDYALGIDVLMRHQSGMISTLQEKYLTYRESTATVEYMQNPATGEQGDWFNLKCQYYFVGYDRNNSLSFDDWILLDWSAVVRATNQGRIQWFERPNTKDGAHASFKFAYFDDFPLECVVARYKADSG